MQPKDSNLNQLSDQNNDTEKSNIYGNTFESQQVNQPNVPHQLNLKMITSGVIHGSYFFRIIGPFAIIVTFFTMDQFTNWRSSIEGLTTTCGIALVLTILAVVIIRKIVPKI